MTWVEPVAGGCHLRVKVVPGASRSTVAGVLGDRLKIRIAAPPEDGRANRALADLLSELTRCNCVVVAGHSSAQKTVLVAQGEVDAIRQLLVPG